MEDRPFRCDYCEKDFASALSKWQHSAKKHPGRKNKKPKVDDDEPSMASLVIEARIAAACGEPVEDWLEEMFYDEIHEK